MRDLVRWALPGLVLVAPLSWLLGAGAPPWPLWLAAAPVLGFVLHQSVRTGWEGRENGFRNRRRPALALIIERGNLSQRADSGDLAYQVYEVVFYQRADWQAARDHAHRCWDVVFLCWSMSFAAAVGGGLSVLALPQRPLLAVCYLLAALPAMFILRRKGWQTYDALQLFDRALVLAHWPLYEAALRAMTGTESGREGVPA